MRTVFTLFLAPLLHPAACAPCRSSCLAPIFVDFIALALRGLPSHYPGKTSQGKQFLRLAVLFSVEEAPVSRELFCRVVGSNEDDVLRKTKVVL